VTELEILNFYNDCHGAIPPWERTRFMERPEVIRLATLDSAKVRTAIRMHFNLSNALRQALADDNWHSRGFNCPLHRIPYCVPCRPVFAPESGEEKLLPPPEPPQKERKDIFKGHGSIDEPRWLPLSHYNY